ncbi:MAG TPA: hypothetical protein VKR52_21435 [Terracidiphilus sp.]|nr:hypothetical protein [Terracidiphilus sp.]
MRNLLVIGLSCAFATSMYGQAVDATVCDILKNPASFNGKIVKVSGTVVAGLDQFVIKGVGCGQMVNAIWLSYPEGTKAKAGPAAMLQLQPASNFAGSVTAVQRTPVTLNKDKEFKQFDSLLSAPYKQGGICIGCVRDEVTATLVGRLDGVAAGLHRDGSGKIVSLDGFGHMNAYSARLVLQSVSDVTSVGINYGSEPAALQDDSVPESEGGDEVAAAHKAAAAFGAGNPAGDAVERAAAAFGKQGDRNGVVVSFGAANEISPKSEEKWEAESPDGVAFNVTFNPSRLKGVAEAVAIALIGAEIADIRSPKAGSSSSDVFQRESDGWEAATLAAIGSGLKTLRAPGGYLMWNRSWAPADRQKLAQEAFQKFLLNQELMTQ